MDRMLFRGVGPLDGQVVDPDQPNPALHQPARRLNAQTRKRGIERRTSPKPARVGRPQQKAFGGGRDVLSRQLFWTDLAPRIRKVHDPGRPHQDLRSDLDDRSSSFDEMAVRIDVRYTEIYEGLHAD